MTNIKFGRWESVSLIVNAICIQIFLSYPRTVAEKAATSGWMIVVYNFALAFAAFMVISWLFKKFEGKDILDISEYTGGKILRVAIGTVFIIYFVLTISMILKEFAESMRAISFQNTDVSYIVLILLAVMLLGAFIGIESIVRFHGIMVPVIVFGFLIIIFGVASYFDFSNLLPIMGKGSYSIFVQGFKGISVFSPLIILFIITPFIRTHRNLRAVGYITISVSALLLLMSVVSYLMVIPYPVAAENNMPVYQMARLIEVPGLIERIESVFIAVWTVAALLYLTAAFYFIIYIIKKTFNIKRFKSFIVPVGIIIFFITLMPEGITAMYQTETFLFGGFAWIAAFLVPAVILIIASIRNKGVSK